ncbi:hypothetical protein BDF19DRAFT_437196 [Syncephalis fuscata]|nr:hypothetical protein BDF19DRAFT_437196 [Syncephalis fuscata]
MRQGGQAMFLHSATQAMSPLQRHRHGGSVPRRLSLSYRPMTLSTISSVIIVLLLCFMQVEAGSPVVKSRWFNHLPNKLSFFGSQPTVLYFDSDDKVVYQSEQVGQEWQPVKDVPAGKVVSMHIHPFDDQLAFLLTASKKHYVTHDRGASWSAFDTPLPPSRTGKPLAFHAERSNYIMFFGENCSSGGKCQRDAFATRDTFDTAPKLLLRNAQQCIWARSTPNTSLAPVKTILCIEVVSSLSKSKVHHQLVRSDNLFSSREVVKLETNSGKHVIQSAISLGATEGFIVMAGNDVISNDVQLWVTQDTHTWARAHLPSGIGIKDNDYTILESSAHSLNVEVASEHQKNNQDERHGTLLSSNSNGTFYTISLPYTSRSAITGKVDYERVANVEGIALANTVDALSKTEANSHIKTKITFDDGGSWRFVKPPLVDEKGNAYGCGNEIRLNQCSLHLHSVTETRNIGRVFSAPGAPGYLMGIGNVGEFLLPYAEGDTFASKDGGVTWQLVARGPHKWEIGDAGNLWVLVADKGGDGINKVKWSSDQGEHWHTLDLDETIVPHALTTTRKSDQRQFILVGSAVNPKEGRKAQHCVLHLDFTSIQTRKCHFEEKENDDFELWRVRSMLIDSKCIMGHRTWFWRKKKSVECYVGRSMDTPAKQENCPCQKQDFECDYNYVRDGQNECILKGKERIPSGKCTKEGENYIGSSGYRLITGNTCDREKGEQLDELKEKPCPKVRVVKPPEGKVTHTETIFNSLLGDIISFKNSSTMLLKTMNGQLWHSPDEAANWKLVKLKGTVIYAATHPTDPLRAYIITDQDAVYISKDRGVTFDQITTPLPPNKLNLPWLEFHPNKPSSILFTGSTECPGCHTEVHVSHDDGQTWHMVKSWVQSCRFRGPKIDIYCIAYKHTSGTSQDKLAGKSTDDNPLTLQSMAESDRSWRQLLTRVYEMQIYDTFVLATTRQGSDMNIYTSEDGIKFTPALFPPNLRVDGHAFTLLTSGSGALFVDILNRKTANKEYGALFSSNYNGTKFSLSLANTNRNEGGLVDVERLSAVQVDATTKKQIVTYMSYNDGRTWSTLKAPEQDMEGRAYNCDKKCTLHLHGQSTAGNQGEIFSSPGTPGLLMGVGNVGDQLLPINKAHTYLSRDAGQTWSEIGKGANFHEFGNYGALIVMVDQLVPTKVLQYSWDMGEHWHTYTFSSKSIKITTLTTRPGSTSTKFILVGILASNGNDDNGPTEDMQQIVIQVNFSQLEPNHCEHNEDKEKSDFEVWDPLENVEATCFLGQKTLYWRRKLDRVCLIDDGKHGLPKPQQEVCNCQIDDYECDNGFWRDEDGKCSLLGLDPRRPPQCDKNATYKGSTGYVKNPRSQCTGGEKLDGTIDRKCSESKGAHADITRLSHLIQNQFYFPKSENVMIHLLNGQVWHKADLNAILVANEKKKHYITKNQGATLTEISTPTSPSTFDVPVFKFHPTEADWLIYIGNKYCSDDENEDEGDDKEKGQCQAQAYSSKNGGETWTLLTSYVRQCDWLFTPKLKAYEKDAIVCEVYQQASGSQRTFVDNPLELVIGHQEFKAKKIALTPIVGYSIIDSFIMVAVSEKDGTGLRLLVSKDGLTFINTEFPSRENVLHQAYTLLEPTHETLTLHITESAKKGAEWGNLLNSNWNGTYYTQSLGHVNRNEKGLVDFERILGIEGVAMANQVANTQELASKLNTHSKQLRSVITFDNGKTWNSLPVPKSNIHGRPLTCSTKPCALHLHSFTEKEDSTNIFSAPTAIGLMMGVGNVGAHLEAYNKADTFLTRDAGHSWQVIQQGPHLYEFGDHGGIIVLVSDQVPIDYVLYSLNEGKTFEKFYFTSSDKKMRITSLTTEPTSTSRRFLLFGTANRGATEQIIIRIDFNGLQQRKCILDMDNEGSNQNDFEWWRPTSQAKKQDDHDDDDSNKELRHCLFGHETKYVRRIPDRDCYIGHKFTGVTQHVRNCTCTEADFECDYNYVRDEQNRCVLAPGITEVAHGTCNADGYMRLSSGYRRIGLSTCQGGTELDQGELVDCNVGNSVGWTLFKVFFWIALIALIGLLWFSKSEWVYDWISNYRRNQQHRRTGSTGSQQYVQFRGFGLFDISWPSMPQFSAGQLPTWLGNLFRRVPYARLDRRRRRGGYETDNLFEEEEMFSDAELIDM